MKFLLMSLLLLNLAACSGSKSKNRASETDTGIILADSEEFSDEAIEDGGVIAEDDLDVDGESIADESTGGDDINLDSEGLESENFVTESDLNIDSGAEAKWNVTGNETLMIIAFKIYGDYDRWRDLARLNADQLKGNYNLREGMSLRYNVPSEAFVWNPEGNPYLIQQGDTLGSISSTTYGTQRYWKNIWDNNKVLIKNPNKIFAGFTLYTPIIDRDVANQ